MGLPTHWSPANINAEFNGPGSLAIAVGDLLYVDTVNHVLKPLSSFADNGTAAKMQAAVAPLFAGVSLTQRLVGDSVAGIVRSLIDGIYDFPCESATFNEGDFVGPSYNVNVLRTQTVAKVSFPHLAIGRVVKRYGSATLTVKCRLMSRYFLGLHDMFRGMPIPQGTGKTALADADTTLTVDSNPMLEMTPTANPRKLVMPLETLSAGVVKWVTNLAAMTNGIQVRNNADNTTIVTIPAAKTGILWCDGATWRGIVSA